MKKIFFSLFVAAVFLACSSSDDKKDAGSVAVGAPPGLDGGPPGINGTIAGDKFSAVSGYAFKHPEGTIDLVFSSAAGACDDAKNGTLPKSSSIVFLFGIGKEDLALGDGGVAGPAQVGPNFSANVRYLTTLPCFPNQPITEAQLGNESKAASVTLNLTKLDADVVEGQVDFAFEDTSRINGSFHVVTCPVVQPDASKCR